MVVFPHSGELRSLRENEATLEGLIGNSLQDTLQSEEKPSVETHSGGERIKHMYLLGCCSGLTRIPPSICECDLFGNRIFADVIKLGILR